MTITTEARAAFAARVNQIAECTIAFIAANTPADKQDLIPAMTAAMYSERDALIAKADKRWAGGAGNTTLWCEMQDKALRSEIMAAARAAALA